MSNKKYILVVDDEELMHELINVNLSKSSIPFSIYNALTGEEGVEKYKELVKKGKKPDMVVMDINLTAWGEGSIDGIEATRQILEIDSDATVYAYSAWIGDNLGKNLYELGFKKVIERTVRPIVFREIIEEYFNENNGNMNDGEEKTAITAFA
jgi:DNA-binding NarL/FixJ family response regulator